MASAAFPVNAIPITLTPCDSYSNLACSSIVVLPEPAIPSTAIYLLEDDNIKLIASFCPFESSQP